MRRLAWVQQVDAVIRCDGPVIMLAGTIHARKGLLMEQAFHTVLAGNPFQRLHHDVVMIHGHIGFCIDRSQLMLGRSHLIVLSLGAYAQFPELYIDVLHKGSDSLADRPKIMVIHLLALGRHRAKQRAAAVDQILSLQKFLSVHQEIFLFRSYGRCHLL